MKLTKEELSKIYDNRDIKALTQLTTDVSPEDFFNFFHIDENLHLLLKPATPLYCQQVMVVREKKSEPGEQKKIILEVEEDESLRVQMLKIVTDKLLTYDNPLHTKLLLQRALTNGKDESTLLLNISKFENPAAIEFILKLAALVFNEEELQAYRNSKDPVFGGTALHLTAYNGFFKNILKLLDGNCDPNILSEVTEQNPIRKTPFQVLTFNYSSDKNYALTIWLLSGLDEKEKPFFSRFHSIIDEVAKLKNSESSKVKIEIGKLIVFSRFCQYHPNQYNQLADHLNLLTKTCIDNQLEAALFPLLVLFFHTSNEIAFKDQVLNFIREKGNADPKFFEALLKKKAPDLEKDAKGDKNILPGQFFEAKFLHLCMHNQNYSWESIKIFCRVISNYFRASPEIIEVFLREIDNNDCVRQILIDNPGFIQKILDQQINKPNIFEELRSITEIKGLQLKPYKPAHLHLMKQQFSAHPDLKSLNVFGLTAIDYSGFKYDNLKLFFKETPLASLNPILDKVPFELLRNLMELELLRFEIVNTNPTKDKEIYLKLTDTLIQKLANFQERPIVIHYFLRCEWPNGNTFKQSVVKHFYLQLLKSSESNIHLDVMNVLTSMMDDPSAINEVCDGFKGLLINKRPLSLHPQTAYPIFKNMAILLTTGYIGKMDSEIKKEQKPSSNRAGFLASKSPLEQKKEYAQKLREEILKRNGDDVIQIINREHQSHHCPTDLEQTLWNAFKPFAQLISDLRTIASMAVGCMK